MRKATWLGAAFVLLGAALAAWQYGRERGTVTSLAYHSATVGEMRRMLVYLPAGYPSDAPYPVLYLLHGAGDDEMAWQNQGAAGAILDRLHADKKIVPMILVMPNGFIPAQTSKAFEEELLNDVIPHIDSHYPTRTNADGRALAGVSLGGGRALTIGVKHLDTFAWIGGFSPSLAGTEPRHSVAEPGEMKSRLKLLWISCGAADDLLDLSKSIHDALDEKELPHIWHNGPGGHEWSVWKNDLSMFATRLFRE